MMRYPSELKHEMVRKLCSIGGPSAYQLSEKTGISVGSLYRWVEDLSGEKLMSKKSAPKKWSTEKKMDAVIKLKTFNDQEFGEFLRSNGLHSALVKEWESEMFKGLESVNKGPGRPKKPTELVALEIEVKALKKDIRRKDRALAEQSALLILQKKVQSYSWMEDEE